MSAVTLESLRADFEAADAAFEAKMCEPLGIMEWEDWFTQRDVLEKAAEFAEAMFLIARDHGLQAALLYKLSDGNLDPRKAGAQ